MPSDFYHWLVLAALKATIILPLMLLAVWVSRRTSSAIIALLLACGLFAIPFSPLVDVLPVSWKVTIPVLESTGAFPDEIPELAKFDQENPLPPPANAIVYVEKKSLTKERIIVGIWLLGVIALAVVRLWRSMNLRLRFSSSVLATTGDPVLDEVKSLCEYLKMKQVPWLLYNSSIKGPQISGVLRPMILVPNHFSEMPSEQRMMILLHELAHIRRKDIPVRILLELIMILFWFHPLVWYALKQYDLLTEKSCDDEVLHAEYPASKYGEALLASVRNTPPSGSMVAAPKQLRERMFSVVDKTKQRNPLSKQSSWKFALLFLALIVPFCLISFTPYYKDLGYETVEHNDTLRALWRMKLGQGSIIADSSGGEHHGKIFGAKWVQDPERGTCLSFDGKDDLLLLRAPHAAWSERPFTFCIWLKPAVDSDGGGLLLRGDLNQTWCNAQGSGAKFGEREIMLGGAFQKKQFSQHSPGLFPGLNFHSMTAARADRAIPDGEWTHLSVVWRPVGNTALIQIFLNGKKVETVYLHDIDNQRNRDWPAPVWHFGFGESPIVRNNNYEGLASDMAIYQKLLLPAEVKRVMRGQFSSHK